MEVWPIYTRFKSTKKEKTPDCRPSYPQVENKVGWLGLVELAELRQLGKIVFFPNFVLDKKGHCTFSHQVLPK